MNVLLVSQCDKRALTETRRILDQFAERRGDRTWQTAITLDGLNTLRRLLRQSARKNTAVACHWIRGQDRSEVLWTVGDARRFNRRGATPTNTTTHDILRAKDENAWHSADLIVCLTDLAGLLHDLGKATEAFQAQLKKPRPERNRIRHEWVSLRLLQAFVGDDEDTTWLARLAAPTSADDASWVSRLHCDAAEEINPSPFVSMTRSPLAQALGWLVLTHHRLPVLPYAQARNFQSSQLSHVLQQLAPSWNEEAFDAASSESLAPYWNFPLGLPCHATEWKKRAARIALKLQRYATQPEAKGVLDNPFVLHLARLALMLADHHYSSLQLGADGKPDAERIRVNHPSALVANTLDGRQANQSLDEHLLGVAQHGAEVARFLPGFARNLPRLGGHRRFKQRAKNELFRWQDKAADLAASWREASELAGAFIVDMASTGCGKTLANARIMYALADPDQGMRCAFAMGLRTLTLQTGQAFRDKLGLGDEDLAVRVGGAANRALFDHYEAQAEASGSASRQDLIDEDAHVLFEGEIDRHPLLRRAVRDPKVRRLLSAPLLVCTIDHLTPATESQRGGRQIAPMLRLMSGDLVLDEPDDFDLSDLPALTRLVHWAGLLGARVLLSSATLPPAIVLGLFEAYRHGRTHYHANCAAVPGQLAPPVACLWVDEFHQSASECDAANFESEHQAFVNRRAARLAAQADTPRRRLRLVPLELPHRDEHAAAQAFAAQILSLVLPLHQAHSTQDCVSGKRVSFGLVRMANIGPLFEVAQALYKQGAPAGVRVHLCVYHSRFPLLLRSAIERRLDAALKRHDPAAVFKLPEVREHLDSHPELEHVFIVLGSPVTEVGRDHDYDWAMVEPSSLRSLIQLMGRVRRHRDGDCGVPNVLVFSHNLRHFRRPGLAAYCRPGFELDEGQFRLLEHDLQQLLPLAEGGVLDARPRIQSLPAEQLRPQHRWADLEHARLRDAMLVRSVAAAAATGRLGRSRSAGRPPTLNAASWWSLPPRDALLTGLIQQQQRFRDNSGPPEVNLVLLPDEDEEGAVLHCVLDGDAHRLRSDPLYVKVEESLHHPVADSAVTGLAIGPWGECDYLEELKRLALELDLPLRQCAERFGVFSAPTNEAGWQSHATLGFVQRRRE